MKSCLIVEDDFSFALEVEMILKELDFQSIDFAKSISETKSFLQDKSYTLIVSDIKLGHGEFAYEYFNSIEIDTPIIYTSVLKQDSVYKEVQQKRKHLYLVKPIDRISMKSAVESVIEQKVKEEIKTTFSIKVKGEIIQRRKKDLILIQALGNYCTLHLVGDEKHTVRNLLSHWRQTLDNNQFVSAHRSYIINENKVDRVIANRNLIIVDNQEIPIGRKYKKELIDRFRF